VHPQVLAALEDMFTGLHRTHTAADQAGRLTVRSSAIKDGECAGRPASPARLTCGAHALPRSARTPSRAHAVIARQSPRRRAAVSRSLKAPGRRTRTSTPRRGCCCRCRRFLRRLRRLRRLAASRGRALSCAARGRAAGASGRVLACGQRTRERRGRATHSQRGGAAARAG
jgi:hypothetical protein